MSRVRSIRLPRAVQRIVRPAVIAQFSLAAASLASVAILSRLLSKTDYGIYAALIAALAFTNAFVGTALGTDVLAESVSSKGIAVHLRIPDVLKAGSLVVLGAVPIAACLAGWSVVPVAVCCGLALVFAEVTQGVMLGRGEQRRYLGAAVTRSAVSVLLLPVLIVLPSSARLAVAMAVLGVGALSFAAFALRRVRFGGGNGAPPLRALSAIGVANLGLWLLATGDRVVLGVRSGAASVAVYAVAYGLIDRVIRSFVNGNVAEWLPEAFGFQEAQRRVRNLSRVGTFGVALTLCVTLLAVAVRPGIELLTGGRFSPSVEMGVLLAIGIGLLGVASPLYVMLVSAGRARIAAWAAMIAAGVNLGGNWLFDPRWGAMAAAGLTVAGYAVFVVIASFGHRAVVGHATRSQRAPDRMPIGWSGL